ncbi:DNA topoisomerase 3-alpha, partial [Spiromyces aspiralis]
EVKGNVLSYGSCQFPTLGFVVDQFLKVENFVSEPFWFLHAEHTQRCEGGEDARVSFTWRRRRLFDQEVCFVIYAACMEDPTARVVKVTARPKEKWRPLPLTTVELQKAGSRHLRLSPDRVMTVAEGLYNKGLISYPRTETNVFDKSMDLRGLVEKQAGNRQWGEFARRLLDGEFRWPRQGKNNDNAHPPVHPLVPADGLSGDDARVYEFVCRRFLACCANNAKGHYTEVTVEIGSEQFAAEGLMVVARNYLDVYHPYERWEGSAHIPVYREGDTFMPTMFEMRDGATTAPRLLRYEDLVGLMEKNEIGTDATIHEHIKRVIERGYVHKQADGSLRPSTLGVALVEGYDAIGLDLSLCKPYLRRELELALKEICRGSLDSVAVKRKAVEMYRVVYQQSRQEFGRIVDALTRHFGHGPDLDEGGPGAGSQSARAVVVQEQDPAVFACPGCVGGVMRVRQRRDGRWMLGCSRYPACNRAVWMSDCVVGAGVSEATCGVCSISSSNNGGSGNVEGGTVYQLNLQFKPGSMPAYIGESYVGCLRGCDETLNQLIPSIQAMLAGNAAGGRCDNAGNNGNGNGNGSGSGSGGGVHEMASPFSLSGYALDSEAITATASKPKCHCGLFANRLTTRKEGSNFGRDYYKCSRQMRQCGFY